MPKMLKGDRGYDFSYSGLKTAVVNYCHNLTQAGKGLPVADIARSFQTAACDVLVEKTVQAVKQAGYSTVSMGGGVAANAYLRQKMQQAAQKYHFQLYMPEKRLCTDNGAMIAAEGYLQYVHTQNRAGWDLNASATIPSFLKEYQP